MRCSGARGTSSPSELELHGHRVSYRTAGSGPALLLLHGIANSSETWERVAPLLSERFTLIAPDLLGHGQSATPRGDYSLGAHASAARDIVTALGHERVTVVGHSLGGGIAMQFAYQFPERWSGSCSSPAAGSAARCTCCCAPRRCRAPTTCCPRSPRSGCSGSGAARRPARAASGCGPSGDIEVLAPRLRVARQRRLAPGVPAHGARGDRARRPARQRAEPAPPRRPAADADRVGRARLDHPGRARRRRARGDARQPLRGLPGRRAHAPRRRPGALRRAAHGVLRRDRAGTAHRRPLAAAARRERRP